MIQRDSPIPLYYQLHELLVDRINSDEWGPGDMLPTEEQLQMQYQVSRSTVRHALRELEMEGRITRHRGRGTFVAQTKISHSAEPHLSLSFVLEQRGVKPGWKVIASGWLPASAEVATRLKLEPATPVFRLSRLRLANEEPIGFHMAHVSPTAATAISKDHLDLEGSLAYLGGNDQLSGSVAHRTIEAIPASEEMAHMLRIDRGAPILLINRLIVGRDDVPIETLQAMYRGDRFQYHIGPHSATEAAASGD